TSRLVDKCERPPAGGFGHAAILPVDLFLMRGVHTSSARGRRSKLNSRAGTGLMCLYSTPIHADSRQNRRSYDLRLCTNVDKSGRGEISRGQCWPRLSVTLAATWAPCAPRMQPCDAQVSRCDAPV